MPNITTNHAITNTNSSRQWSGGGRIFFSLYSTLCVYVPVFCRLKLKVPIRLQEVLDFGFHALDSGFQLLDFGFLSVELALRHPIVHAEL